MPAVSERQRALGERVSERRLRITARARVAPRAAVRRVRALPLPLVLLIVLAVVQAVVWSALTPPLEGPDESAHAAYAQHLAETGHGPQRNTGTGSLSTELSHVGYDLNLVPILGHLEGQPTWSAVRHESATLAHLPPSARKDGSGPNALAQNPPLYYVYEALAYRLSPNQSALGRLFWMRLANVPLYVMTVIFTWLAAGLLFTRQWVQFLATAAVTLNPKLASLAGTINSDTLLVTISTAFLFASLRLLRRGPTLRGVAALAGLAGLGVLTHGRGLFLVPPMVVALVIAVARARPPLRRRFALAGLAGAVLVGCVIVAWLWTRSDSGATGAFGGEINQAATQSFTLRGFLSYLWQFYFPRFSFMQPPPGVPYGYRQAYIETYFGGYSYFEINFRTAVYDWLQILAFLGLLALWTTAVARWQAIRRRWPDVVVAVAMFLSLIGLLHLSDYRDLQQGGSPLFTGRYLVPGIALYGAAIAWVVGSLRRPLGWIVAAGFLAGFVLLDIEGLLITMHRFYA
jgi:4-amino-4-deoxy-L-arabinose transferase-like glycosyltransferase